MCVVQAIEGSRFHTCRNNNYVPFHDKSVQDCQLISKTPILMQMLR